MSSNPPQASCCATVSLHTGTPKGHVEQIGGVDCYVTENYKQDAGKYLLIFPDIFGIELVNTRLVADTFAKQLDYPVVLIDILSRDPFAGEFDTFPDWKAQHSPEKTAAIVVAFLDAFKASHTFQFLAGIGYCFGAKYLAHHLTASGIFNVGAFAHPSFVSDEELDKISKPLIISCAETDSIFSKDLRYKSEEILSKNKVHYQMDLYSHTSHGFAVRGDLSQPLIKYAATKALIDQVYFFKYHEN